MIWTVNVQRDSVCMGDDVTAPNTKALRADSEMRLAQLLKLAADAMPTVCDPEPIVWSVHSGSKYGELLGLIETVWQVGSKVRLLVPDRKIQDMGVSLLYCRYFCKSSLMRPDEQGRLRIPMYPECATLAEKVMKHLNAGEG